MLTRALAACVPEALHAACGSEPSCAELPAGWYLCHTDMAAAASGAVAPVPPPSPGDSVAAQLCRACKLGDAEAAARLLDKLGDPDVSDARGSTPLMHAAWHGHLSVIKVLLERGCNPNVSVNRLQTRSVYHCALTRSHVGYAPCRCAARPAMLARTLPSTLLTRRGTK